ncbi:MAG: undecaprenyl-phosphate glucose phosphotransferase [Deltaproteobacteria bacterium]|nr:undecaprenyl-phosphate glucose phosphotransferase [Deltaproteobacteria bacterium]
MDLVVRGSSGYLILAIGTCITTIVVFNAMELYQPWRGANLTRLVRRVFLSWMMIVGVLLTLGFLSKTSHYYSRAVLLLWLILTPFALVVFRLIVYLSLRWARAQGRNTRTAVIGGAGDLGKRLAKNMKDTPWLGMHLRGFFDDFWEEGEIALQPGSKSYPVLGNLDSLADYVQAEKIDMVYLALPLRSENRIREVVNALQDTTASVYFVPDVFTFSLLQATITDLRGIPLISLWESPFYGINGWLKRVEDAILASLILLFVSPLMAAIALGVKFSSPGPVIFRQRRYGLDGEEIIIYKFRTMEVCQDGPEIPQATQNDHRVTPLGRFLRRTSLDELPQFINVLQGTMSVVGPRPHAVAHNEFYRSRIPGYMLRHKVRPGITGWAQINGWRGETESLEKMEKRVEYDLDYLVRWSLGLDLKIIFLTTFRLFSDRQAY